MGSFLFTTSFEMNLNFVLFSFVYVWNKPDTPSHIWLLYKRLFGLEKCKESIRGHSLQKKLHWNDAETHLWSSRQKKVNCLLSQFKYGTISISGRVSQVEATIVLILSTTFIGPLNSIIDQWRQTHTGRHCSPLCRTNFTNFLLLW